MLTYLVFVALSPNTTSMKSLAQSLKMELTTPIPVPVLFFCTVSGEQISAHFNGVIDNPLYFCYRVKFSTGYEDNFTLLQNGFVEGDNSKDSAAYALAIKEDLQALVHLSAENSIYTLRWQIDNVPCNVWVFESSLAGERIYKVCYNSHYQFQLKKAGAGWLASNAKDSHPTIIDNKLAAEIGRVIERERGAV